MAGKGLLDSAPRTCLFDGFVRFESTTYEDRQRASTIAIDSAPQSDGGEAHGRSEHQI
ncbi:hypothetical protein GQ600_19461 [Phytophthora cactorum]|nr:hypothetical protein GQ600_19461 [Phytophthora cactorum]